MNRIASFFVLALADMALAAPPVTDMTVPSPAAELALRWEKASRELEGGATPRTEAARMLLAARNDEKLGPGVGWYDAASRRYDWKWLAARCDADGDGRVTAQELSDSAVFFKRLDRDGDGAVSAEDLDWSEKSPWVKQDAQALRLFRQIDADGNGRVSDDELLAFMKKRSGDKGFLTTEDVRTMLAGERPGKAERRVSKEVWIKSLTAGDLGSAFEGPRAGETAPDFTLPRQNGKGSVTLSEFRDVKPVVLIFGSFT